MNYIWMLVLDFNFNVLQFYWYLLNLKFIIINGGLICVLIHTNVTKYLNFKVVDCSFVHNKGEVRNLISLVCYSLILRIRILDNNVQFWKTRSNLQNTCNWCWSLEVYIDGIIWKPSCEKILHLYAGLRRVWSTISWRARS